MRRLQHFHEIPTWKTLGDRGEAWVLQIAGTGWGSGSGDLRVLKHLLLSTALENLHRDFQQHSLFYVLSPINRKRGAGC